MFAQRAFLIQRLKEKREVIEQLVANAPYDKEIYAGWKMKELLAHLSGWDDAIVDVLQAHAKRKPVNRTVSTGINAYNAKTVRTRESLSLEQVIKEWKATRELVFHALDDLPDEKFNQQLTFPGANRARLLISLKFSWSTRSTMPDTSHNGRKIQMKLLASIKQTTPRYPGRCAFNSTF
jgi:hypothetical protein